jgi:hypothetical protein
MRSCSVEACQSCSTACSTVVLNQTSSTDPYSQTHTDGTLRTLLSPRRALHQLTTSPPPSQCSKAGAESCRRRWLQHARCGPVRSMHVGRATGGDRNTKLPLQMRRRCHIGSMQRDHEVKNISPRRKDRLRAGKVRRGLERSSAK